MSNVREVTVNPYEEFGLLGFLNTNLDKFPSMRGVVESHAINSASLFAPQTLNMLDSEISRNPNLVYEGYFLLDLILTFCVQTGQDFETIVEQFVTGAVSTRVVEDFGMTISKDTLDPFVFSEKESAECLLRSNKTLLALYIYTLLINIF